VNLNELDVTANFISCISASGLHVCSKLTKLGLAGNQISSQSEVSWLRYCKSVQAVRVHLPLCVSLHTTVSPNRCRPSQLTLEHNPVVKKVKNMRLFVMCVAQACLVMVPSLACLTVRGHSRSYHTRQNLGLPKRSGLLQLDGKTIGLDERVEVRCRAVVAPALSV